MSELSILFADDEATVTDKYACYLRGHYKNVYKAYDGLEAYRLYHAKKPDVIILDLYLPLLTGIELLKRIRENDNHTIVIVLSAFSQKSMIEAISSHIYDYIIKPISRGDLKEMLGEIDKLHCQGKLT